MLSLFLTDYKVGVYSFAAIFFEGLYQIPTLVRTNLNPILVSFIKKYKKIKFNKFIYNSMLLSLTITTICILVINLIYPYCNPLFPDNIINKSYIILLILCTGLFVYSAFIPLDFIFMQAGFPGVQSIFMIINILINIILNSILIPHYGLNGAAIATSISLILSGFNLLLFIKFIKIN